MISSPFFIDLIAISMKNCNFSRKITSFNDFVEVFNVFHYFFNKNRKKFEKI